MPARSPHTLERHGANSTDHINPLIRPDLGAGTSPTHHRDWLWSSRMGGKEPDDAMHETMDHTRVEYHGRTPFRRGKNETRRGLQRHARELIISPGVRGRLEPIT